MALRGAHPLAWLVAARRDSGCASSDSLTVSVPGVRGAGDARQSGLGASARQWNGAVYVPVSSLRWLVRRGLARRRAEPVRFGVTAGGRLRIEGVAAGTYELAAGFVTATGSRRTCSASGRSLFGVRVASAYHELELFAPLTSLDALFAWSRRALSDQQPTFARRAGGDSLSL